MSLPPETNGNVLSASAPSSVAPPPAPASPAPTPAATKTVVCPTGFPSGSVEAIRPRTPLQARVTFCPF